MYFIIQKCGYVDKKLSFYFISSFYLLPFKFLAKSVDRWTSSEKKISPLYAIIRKYRHVDKKLSFNFMFSFLYVPFIIYGKSVDRWTRALNILKKGHVLHCVEMWTRSCFSISCEYVFEQFRKTLKKNCEKLSYMTKN